MQPKRYIVSGAGGFVGRALARALKSQGVEVSGLARGDYPELRSEGIQMLRCDLGAHDLGLEKVFRGAEAVFHVAAKVDMWGPYSDFYRNNIQATRNVIAACRAARVRKLIFTSSPSVVAHGKDLCGVDESTPYPKHYEAYYPQTKAAAEAEVLAANDDGLWTIALRPHLIFGPGDTNLIPTVLERARNGRLVQVGPGTNMTDLSFISDCVRAHMLAEEALGSNPSVRGRAYFISQGEPVNMWGWINQVLQANGLKPVSRRVPLSIAKALAVVSELFSKFSGREPMLSRFLVSEMASSHYFNISAARRDLGYEPQYSVAQAMQATFGAAA